jgi:hypothetical protein
VSSKWIVAKTTRCPKTRFEEINGDLLEADFSPGWVESRPGNDFRLAVIRPELNAKCWDQSLQADDIDSGYRAFPENISASENIAHRSLELLRNPFESVRYR